MGLLLPERACSLPEVTTADAIARQIGTRNGLFVGECVDDSKGQRTG